jgi:hypothetical protein
VTSSARGTIGPVIPGDDAGGWNVALYLAGRNDLAPDLARQARAVDAVRRRAGPRVAVSILLAGPARSWVRLADRRRERWEGDSGSGATLAAFAGAASAVAPARPCALVIGSHGDGWSVGHRVGALATDGLTGSSLSTAELGRALANLHRARGRRLEVLVLDACLMGTVETLVEVAGHVDLLVAPSTRTPRVGADHAAVVRDLAAPFGGDERDGADAAAGTDAGAPSPAAAAARWLRHWSPTAGAATFAPTVSIFDRRGVPELVAALDRFGHALAACRLGDDGAAVERARLDAARGAPELVDLGSFAAVVRRTRLRSPHRTEVRRGAAELQQLLAPGGPLIVATSAAGSDRGALGLAIALPRAGRPHGYDPRWLQAARISGWCSHLDSSGRSPAAPLP